MRTTVVELLSISSILVIKKEPRTETHLSLHQKKVRLGCHLATNNVIHTGNEVQNLWKENFSVVVKLWKQNVSIPLNSKTFNKMKFFDFTPFFQELI